MKKRFYILTFFISVLFLLVSCSNPDSLVGTTWKANTILVQATLNFYDSNNVTMSLKNSLLGIDDNDAFEYSYNDPEIWISGYATGKVSGNSMRLTPFDPTFPSITFWKQ